MHRAITWSPGEERARGPANSRAWPTPLRGRATRYVAWYSPGLGISVFDPDGRVLGFVETPKGPRIGQIGENYILGHYPDELEVEYVQLWPLERSGG